MTTRSSHHDSTISPWRRVAIFLAGAMCMALCSRAEATIFKTYITGESGVEPPAGEKHVIFTVTFDPAVPLSGVIVTELEDTLHRLDGIDFVPGTGETEVVAGGTHLAGADGVIGHYDVAAGVILPPAFIPSTKSAPVPPPRITHPSSVKSTDTHFYYVENQFGFEGADPHRIMRAPFGAPKPIPAAEIVLDSASSGGLEQFEGLEIHDGRLYFFALDPDTSDPTLKRALFSVPLTPAGLPSGPPVKELGGLTRGLGSTGVGPGVSDGSDELDYDPFTGLLWGTNIIDGQLIAFDPAFAGAPVGGGAVVLDATAIGAGTPFGLGLLTRTIDGIRSTGEGHLVFVGLEGTIGSISLAGFVAGGGLGAGTIVDADVFPLFDDRLDDSPIGLEFAFDDLTPLSVAVPEPSSVLLAVLGLCGLGLLAWRRKRV